MIDSRHGYQLPLPADLDTNINLDTDIEAADITRFKFALYRVIMNDRCHSNNPWSRSSKYLPYDAYLGNPA